MPHVVSIPPKYAVLPWREGSKGDLASRFAAVRVRPSHRDYWRAEPRRDFHDLKQEIGLDHYEGRGWRGQSIARERFMAPRRQRARPQRFYGYWYVVCPFARSVQLRELIFLRLGAARREINLRAEAPSIAAVRYGVRVMTIPRAASSFDGATDASR
jgi:hypothetical protein